jgi:Flp pilus assembly pilin Flp
MANPTKDATCRRGSRALASQASQASPSRASQASRFSRLARFSRLGGARGAAMTEYTVLIGVVALATMGAFIFLGVALVDSFEMRRDFLLYPSP